MRKIIFIIFIIISFSISCKFNNSKNENLKSNYYIVEFISNDTVFWIDSSLYMPKRDGTIWRYIDFYNNEINIIGVDSINIIKKTGIIFYQYQYDFNKDTLIYSVKILKNIKDETN